MRIRETLKIGYLNYLNVLPFYHNLSNQLNKSCFFEFVHGNPAVLAQKFENGLLDATIISSVMALNFSDSYLFQDVGVSSIGKVESVLLFTKEPLHVRMPQRIAVTDESKTSVALLNILLDNNANKINIFSSQEPLAALGKEVEDLEDRRSRRSRRSWQGPQWGPAAGRPEGADFGGAEGALLIGDGALKTLLSIETGKGPNDLVITDLGELWYKMTKHPMVWASWIARQSLGHGTLTVLEDLLNASAFVAPDILLELARQEAGRNELSEDRILSYWNRFKYRLDNSAKIGLKEFLKRRPIK